MDLTPRQLAFLEHEMSQIIEDDERSGADKKHASSILGRVEGEIEWEKEQHDDDTDPKELFS